MSNVIDLRKGDRGARALQILRAAKTAILCLNTRRDNADRPRPSVTLPRLKFMGDPVSDMEYQGGEK